MLRRSKIYFPRSFEILFARSCLSTGYLEHFLFLNTDLACAFEMVKRENFLRSERLGLVEKAEKGKFRDLLDKGGLFMFRILLGFGLGLELRVFRRLEGLPLNLP